MAEDLEVLSLSREIRALQAAVRGLSSLKLRDTHGRSQHEARRDIFDSLASAAKLSLDAGKTDDEDVRRDSLSRCDKLMDAFREALLAASRLDLIDAVDVAHISALGDRLQNRMRKVL